MHISFWLVALYLLRFLSAKLIDFLGGNFLGSPAELETVLQLETNRRSAELIEAAFTFEDAAADGDYWVCDYHTHIHGTGSNKGMHDFCPNIPLEPPGVWLTPKRFDWLLHPLLYLQTKVFLDSAGVEHRETGDVEYLQRFYSQIEHFPVHRDRHGNPVKFRFFLFAMAPFHEPCSTAPDLDKTDIAVDSDYVINVADCFNHKLEASGKPHRVVPVISVHPYRRDATDELIRLYHKIKNRGSDEVLVKWLPSAMGIDPRLVQDSYYETMAEYGMILITHTGKEHSAMTDRENQQFSNPLYLRKALEAKAANGRQLKVIMAHSGRKGDNFDAQGKKTSSYKLFKEMMRTEAYRGRLFGDISAIPYMDTANILAAVADEKSELGNRMLNGSDYPVPAVNIIKPTKTLSQNELISREQATALNLVYGYNPLLFDFIMKRMLKLGKQKTPLPEAVFFSISSH